MQSIKVTHRQHGVTVRVIKHDDGTTYTAEVWRREWQRHDLWRGKLIAQHTGDYAVVKAWLGVVLNGDVDSDMPMDVVRIDVQPHKNTMWLARVWSGNIAVFREVCYSEETAHIAAMDYALRFWQRVDTDEEVI